LQSQDLPTIEAYRNDHPKAFEYSNSHEKEFSAKAIFLELVLNNKLLWTIAAACVIAMILIALTWTA